MSRKLVPSIRALTTVPALAAGLLSISGATSGFSQSAPRFAGAADTSTLVALKGSTHPLAQVRFDRGPAPAELAGRMVLLLKRPADQEAALDQWIASQQDPSSPNYRKWLTPEQFGKRFGISDADLQSVTSFLTAEGFAVGRVYGSKNAIEVSGTAEQVRKTFRTEIHEYRVGGRRFYANNSDPKIPSSLSGVASGFAALNNFNTTVAAKATPASFDPATHKARPLYDLPGTSTYGVSPADLNTIYDIPTSASTFGQGGKGVSIGFIGDSNINLNYIANYRSTFGLSANAPVVVVDGNDPGVTSDANIAYKQIELAGAVAPNATIYYYVSATTDYDAGLDFALLRAVNDNVVQVLGIGFQSCETTLGGYTMPFLNQMWKQAAAQGMTVVVESGNSGSAGCDVPGSSTAAVNGLAVNGYASSPYVTAVGGTDFYYSTKGPSTYWNTTNTGYSSAKGYIPEQVWNDSNTGSDYSAGTASLLASGGGLSNAGSDGVSTATAQPSYQTGVVPASISSTVRALPDVAFFAGTGGNNTIGFNSAAYLFCMANTDCASGASQPQFTLSGGTEASTAVFAGAMALVVAYQNALHTPASTGNVGLGNVNPSLYYFVKNSIGTFHDITNGNNEVQCSSKNCTNNYMSGYAAATGYDAATGLGSFDITSLVSKWPTPNTSTASTTLTVTNPATGAAITSVQHSTAVQFTAQVAGSGGAVPTGNVAIFTNSPLASQSGQEVMTLGTVTTKSGTQVGQAVDPSNVYLPGGTYQIAARYAGDSTYAASVSTPVTITITPEPTKMVVYGHNVNYSGSTISYGSPVQITAEPYSAANPSYTSIPSGSLQVYDSGNLITVLPINSEGAATFSSNLLSVGSHSVVLKYTGDASFQSAQTNAFNFSVTSASTSTTLNPSTQNVGEGGNNADGLTAVVTSTTLPSNGSAPTGTVTFSTATPKTATLISGFDPNGNAIATASVTISPGDVPASGVISATYNPPANSNYTKSTSAGVQFTQTTSQYNGTSTVTFTLTDTGGICPTACSQSGISFPTSDALTMNINVNTDTPNDSYVTIYANGTAISGQIYPDTNGNITFPIPRQNGYLLLPSGQVQFTVQYDGWEEYIFGYAYYQSPPASTNLTVNIADNRTSADFSLQSSTTVNQQTPLTAASPTASFGLQLTSIYNFQSAYATTPINLTCAIPNNPGLQCSFSSSAVTLGGSGFATSTLTVSAASGYTIAQSTTPPAPASRWWIAGGGTTLACIFLLGIPSRRRAWQSTLGALVLMAISMGVAGCGAGASSLTTKGLGLTEGGLNGAANNTTATAVKAGTYTVVVTASTTTNTSIIHNLPVSVVVTNQ